MPPKFAVYFRAHNHRDVIQNPNQNDWGWERCDSFEYDTLNEAVSAKEEYAKAFTGQQVVATVVKTPASNRDSD